MEYASLGKRIGGGIIDAILLGIVNAILGAATGGNSAGGGAVNVGTSGGASLLFFMIAIAYFVVLEATQGATVGKMALGMKVVKEDGSAISYGDAAIRTVLRIVDALPCAYIVGMVLISTSDTNQRLGDRVAKTVVINK